MVFFLKVTFEDLKRGLVEVVVENENDLWILSTVLNENDVVTARTTREVKFESGSERVPMTLSIKLQTVEFQPFSDKLRVRGVVVEGPEEFGIRGRHHALTIGVGDRLVIWKQNWFEHQLTRLKESFSLVKVLLIVFDYDDACFALVSEQGVRILEEFSSKMPCRKDYVDFEGGLENYLKELQEKCFKLVDLHGVKMVVVASPLDLSRRLLELLKNGRKGLVTFVDHVSSGGCSSVNEVLARDVFKKAIHSFKLIEINETFDEFKRLVVNEPEKVAYGLDDVEFASSNNAISKLLVSFELLKSMDQDLRVRVNRVIEGVYTRRGEVYVVPRDSPIHNELMGFGGVVALLRFKLFRNT